MWKTFSINGTYKWIGNIQNLVDSYNDKIHRTIKMRPSDVNKSNEKKLLKTVYNKIKLFSLPKYSVGNNVRISKAKHVFEKGYTPNWTTEIFTIHRIRNTNPVTYILADIENKLIKGGFYEYELSKTKYPDTYLVEKVLRKRGKQVFVKWLGFADKHNSWINKQNIL